MKYHLRLSAAISLAVTLLSACTSEDLLSEQTTGAGRMPIAFDNYVSRSITRGMPIASISDLAGSGNDFGVFAMYTNSKKYTSSPKVDDTDGFEDNFMTNVQVTGTESDSGNTCWEYTPLRYWPSSSEDYVSFLAYAPYVDPTSDTEGSIDPTLVNSSGQQEGNRTFITYRLNHSSSENSEANARDTRDLMFNSNNALKQQLYLNSDGKYCVNTNNSNFTDDYRQKISFRHATARIGFAITSSILADKLNFKDGDTEGDAAITVNSFMLSGNPAGTADNENPTGAFVSEGLLNLNNPSDAPTWVLPKFPKKVWFAFNKSDEMVTVPGSLETSGVKNLWTPSDSKPDKEIKATREKVSDGGVVTPIGNSVSDYMFVIPQDFTDSNGSETSGGEGSSLYCYIKYTVKYSSTVSGTSKKDITYSAYGKIKQNFEAGMAYLILVDIGTKQNEELSFKPINFTVIDGNEGGGEDNPDDQPATDKSWELHADVKDIIQL